MTYLDAAETILTQSRQPLHYAEITRRALDQGLITPTGLTPEATMGSRLYTDSKQGDALFTRVGRGIFDLIQRQPGGIDAQVQKINQTTRAELRKHLHAMPFDRFEALIGDLLIEMGFDESTVTVTKRSGDGGIDVTGIYRAAGLTQVNAAVQVKRWQKNIGAPIVTQLRGSLQVHQQGIIITTSDFTKSAHNEAVALSKTPIGLINGTELIDLLIKHRVGVEERTLKVIGLDHEWWGELLVTGSPAAADSPSPSVDAPAGNPPSTVRTPDGMLIDVNMAEPLATDEVPKERIPVAVTLFGHRYHVEEWKDILLLVAGVLASQHPNKFEDLAAEFKGSKHRYVSLNPHEMRRPKPIAGTNLWIESNFSSERIVNLSYRFLAAFAHAPTDLEILTVPRLETDGPP